MRGPAVGGDVGALLDAWVRCWVLARGAGGAVRTPHWWRVPTGTDREHCRWVLTTASVDAVREAAAEAGCATDHLKTAGDPAVWLPHLGRGWRPEPPTWLMSTSLDVVAPPRAPAGYRVEATAGEQATTVAVHTDDGAPAARGFAAVAGDWATFDRIVTEPEHRRRGLGSLVMRQLAEVVGASGVRRAVLVASTEGRALYETLGWRCRSPITGAHRVVDEGSSAETPLGGGPG